MARLGAVAVGSRRGRRAARCVAAAWLVASVLLVGAGCAGSPAPWDVDPDHQARFEETSRICRLLTDDRAGEPVEERFEKCMTRRGWKRQGFIKRLFHRD